MSESRYTRIVERISATPWLILEEKLLEIAEVINFRAEGGRLTEDEIRAKVGDPDAPQPYLTFANEDDELEHIPFEAAARNGRAVGGGAVAVLPLFGTIFPRANLFTDFSGGTTATGFQAMFSQALGDPDVGSILIEVDSPGGMTDMIPETAAVVRAARGQKPIVAVANTLAASAAYYIAAQADEIIAAPSARVGSIGVIGFHTDITEAEAKAGVKTTAIFAGKYKAEGWPTTPLTEEALAARQDLVDQIYNQFVGDVAKGRGVPVTDVRDGYGEGRAVTAKDALKLGLVDRIDTLEATIARMARGNVNSTSARASAQPEDAPLAEEHEDRELALVSGAEPMVAGVGIAGRSYKQKFDPRQGGQNDE